MLAFSAKSLHSLFVIILVITIYLTDMLTQYSNIVQYDQVAGPLHFNYFVVISTEHKIISQSVGGLGSATPHNQT